MIVDQHGTPIDSRSIRNRQRAADRARKIDSLTAAYDAAIDTSENRKHWQWADNNSAAAANSIEVRRKLRQRARYECLEANSFGKGICLTLANDTISTGPSLQVSIPGHPEISRQIEQKWRTWAKAVRLATKLRTARLAKIVDGEAVIIKTNNKRLRTPVTLDIRLVEADQLATPGFIDGTVNKVDGIEFDEYGNPIRYHVLKGHPGDVWPFSAWEKDDVDPDDLIHLFRVERPGQVRGIPEITPALPLFAQLRRYTLAVILAAESAADFAAVLTTQANAFDSETDGVDDIDPFESVQIDRGMMVSLPKGWQMSQFKPEQPTTSYESFRNAILGEIARCVHMPSNKARADSSQYNYSSGRLDHQTYYEAIAVERSQWEVECIDRIFEWWLDEAMMISGYIDAIPQLDEIPHVWRWPPNKDVDPNDQADANIKLITAGLKTRSAYLIEQDIDPEAHQAQLAAEGWTDPVTGTPAAAPAMSDPAQPAAQSGPNGQADNAPPEEQSAPTGEFANISRQQLQRNTKAIDDALAKLSSGEWTVTRVRVFLSSVGMSEKSIDGLISEHEVTNG